jgi:hypothetical protein
LSAALLLLVVLPLLLPVQLRNHHRSLLLLHPMVVALFQLPPLAHLHFQFQHHPLHPQQLSPLRLMEMAVESRTPLLLLLVVLPVQVVEVE